MDFLPRMTSRRISNVQIPDQTVAGRLFLVNDASWTPHPLSVILAGNGRFKQPDRAVFRVNPGR